MNKVKNININVFITILDYNNLIKLKPKAKYLELIFNYKLL